MLIAVDIGNSTINIGYFTGSGLMVQKIATHPLKDATEYQLILNDFLLKNHIEKNHFSCIISSVVSSHTKVLVNTLEGLPDQVKSDVLIVSHYMNSDVRYKIDKPEELGADRIAGATGAFSMYHAPVAVVDCGTATTITVVDRDANIIGGAIMPGIGLMNDILEKGTSRLGRIVLDAPVSPLGKDTAGCISSGLFYGTAGAVERILEEIERKVEFRFKVVITGGYGSVEAGFITRPHEINYNLTLEGLKILHEKNRKS
jgi:type III pantothenate kinase